MAKVKSAKREVGRTTKVGVVQTWCELFERNEKSPKNQKQTDEQISKQMHCEFPTKTSAIFDQVQAVRNRYNKGALLRGKLPKVQSYRYDAEGNKTTVRAGRQTISKKASVRVKAKTKVRVKKA
jgi:hypothetical protein